MSALLTFLIAFPFAAGLALLGLRGRAREAVVLGAAGVVATTAVLTAVRSGAGATIFSGPVLAIDVGPIVFGAELAISGLLAVLAWRHRRLDALALVLGQLGLTLWMELTHRLPRVEPERLFAVDRLSVIMVLIIGVLGPLICVHALGYMRDYHRHAAQLVDRRPLFFFLLFAFLSAMFGLVSANDLSVLHVFWELTTLCSFLLIGYTRTTETITYAFNALSLNLLGGLGFSLALALLAGAPSGLDLARLGAGPASAEILPAVALLALAGLTKSAQLPFSSWLLGAMHAPTPTSALLHSSTMVKAGVFLLLKLSFAMAGSLVGTTVALVGLLTFVLVSVVAITEENAKRVLAWSTIGNLGLVVTCAGLGTPALLWVGVMIVIFHAVAKSLLFLVVGTLENRLHTKDLERFDHLLSRFPRLSVLALAGVSGMFLAPFGIVVAKWSAIRALLELPGWRAPVFLIGLAYGSAATLFYWTKLLTKILAIRQVAQSERALEAQVSGFEWLSEKAHAALLIALTLGLGLISERLVTPYALAVFAAPPQPLLHVGPLLLVVLTLAVLALPALARWFHWRGRYELSDVYLCGRSATADHSADAAGGGTSPVSLRNYYLTGVIDGHWVLRWGTVLCAALVVLMVLGPGVPS
jgi:ech hydrogenase subunit A